MKKLATLLGLAFALCSTSVYADCVGGSSVTGQNGTTYCLSTKAMNWWSGHAWCSKNNMHMATYAEACNRTYCTGLYCCANLGYQRLWERDVSVWINYPIGTEYAVTIESRDNGVVRAGGANEARSKSYRVLCVQ